jgi:hypothetical protein
MGAQELERGGGWLQVTAYLTQQQEAHRTDLEPAKSGKLWITAHEPDACAGLPQIIAGEDRGIHAETVEEEL